MSESIGESSSPIVKDDECSLESNIKFSPPLYIQRYEAVLQILKNSHFKVEKVVDFGSAELSILKYLKSISNVKEISAVDIDEEVLERNILRAAPLAADYLIRRTDPLTIIIYQGSIADRDTRLRQYDAVTCIEIVEHLHEDVLSKFAETIFGFIRPKIAVVTTPNADFNVLFPTLKGFRHWDHKFEWTRQEFSTWCNDIVAKYPFYSVEIDGIGSAPMEHQHLGHCSQVATFQLIFTEYHDDSQVFPCVDMPYQVLATYEHPHRKVTILTPEIILDEVQYYLRTMARQEDWSYDPLHLSLHQLLLYPKIQEVCGSIEAIGQILTTAGYHVFTKENETFVEYKYEESEDERDRSFEYDDEMEN